MTKIANEKQKLGVPNIKTEEKVKSESVQTIPAKPAQPAGNVINKELQKELQKEQRRLNNLEDQITKAKAEETKLENALGDPANYADKDKFVTIESDYKIAKQKRIDFEKEYETIFEKVMELEGQM